MITGKVINSKTGQPIQYANVYYSQDAQGTPPLNQVGTITDEKGEYFISNAEYPFLSVSHVEYKNQTKSIFPTQEAGLNPMPVQDQTINFNLIPDVQMLNLVTISGSIPSIWKKHRNIVMIAVILLIGILYVYVREKKLITL